MSQTYSCPVWLQDLRSDWSIKRIKHSTYLKARVGWHGLTSEDYLDEGSFLLVTGTDFEKGRVNWATCHHVSQERYQQDPFIQLKEGDLLITKDGTIGKIALVEGLSKPATLNSGVFVTRPLQGSYTNRFMYWLLQSGIFQSFINYIKVGTTINHLYQHQLSDFAFPIPSPEIQENIANYLDRKTAAIDLLISQKQRLIQLLEEKRTALINQAVTKGLNSNASTKASGIPWIGEIPRHWGTLALGYACSLTSGGTPDRNNPDYWNGNIPWIKTGEINYNKISEAEEYITELGLANSSAKVAYPGTLLMAMYGQGMTRGRVAILGIEASFNQACLAISPQRLLDVKYLYYYFVSAYKHIRDDGNETSQMNLSSGLIGKIKVLLPTLEEQKEIASLLDSKISQVDFLQKKLKTSIQKLQEYRQSLITSAVTGKLNIPEEVNS